MSKISEKMVPILLLALVTFLTPLKSSSARAGTLDNIRKNVREDKSKKEKDENTDSRSQKKRNHSGRNGCYHYNDCHHNCYSCDEADDETSIIMFYILFSPFWGPYAAVEGNASDPQYLDYPYQNDERGYITHSGHGSTSAFSLTLEGTRTSYGYNQTAEVRFAFAKRLELQLSSKLLIEPTNSRYFDSLHLLQPQFNVVFAMGTHALFRAGAGMNALLDHTSETQFGVNFHYDIDIFPINPLVLSARFAAGTVGEAFTWQSRFSAGVALRNAELFAGYDFNYLASNLIGGPVAGLRLWF